MLLRQRGELREVCFGVYTVNNKDICDFCLACGLSHNKTCCLSAHTILLKYDIISHVWAASMTLNNTGDKCTKIKKNIPAYQPAYRRSSFVIIKLNNNIKCTLTSLGTKHSVLWEKQQTRTPP